VSFLCRDGLAYPWNDDRGVFKVFADFGQQAYLDCKLRIPKAKPLVLSGHSLGGAAAVVAAQMLKDDGWNVKGIYTYGQPYVGNSAFAESYRLPLFRVFQHADIVPKVPFLASVSDMSVGSVWVQLRSGNMWRDRVMVHAGFPVMLDEPGYKDDVKFYTQGMRDLGTKTTLGSISGHFMGNYLGLIYQRLSLADQSFFADMAQELTTSGSFTLFDAAFPPRVAGAVIVPDAQIAAEELTFAQSLLGGSSKAKVRLFQGEYVPPANGQMPALVEATFPGYAPQAPPANARVRGGYPEVVELGPASFVFELAANLFPGQLIGGAYVTYEHADGVERLVDVYPFRDPIRLKETGQQVPLTISATLARFGD
jgi:hypothetical protein